MIYDKKLLSDLLRFSIIYSYYLLFHPFSCHLFDLFLFLSLIGNFNENQKSSDSRFRDGFISRFIVINVFPIVENERKVDQIVLNLLIPTVTFLELNK